MKYWTRITHNFDNEVSRYWEFRENLSDTKCETKSVCGIHALINGRWMTLSEIVCENKKYYEQWNVDNSLDPSGFEESVILDDLVKMENVGWVKSKDS